MEARCRAGRLARVAMACEVVCRAGRKRSAGPAAAGRIGPTPAGSIGWAGRNAGRLRTGRKTGRAHLARGTIQKRKNSARATLMTLRPQKPAFPSAAFPLNFPGIPSHFADHPPNPGCTIIRPPLAVNRHFPWLKPRLGRVGGGAGSPKCCLPPRSPFAAQPRPGRCLPPASRLLPTGDWGDCRSFTTAKPPRFPETEVGRPGYLW